MTPSFLDPSAPTLLITGGTGFLGRSLARSLKSRFRVVLTGRNNEQNRLAELETGCPVIPMDVCRIESVRDGFVEARPTVVIHAAASKFVDLAERNPHECIDVNVAGSQNVGRVAMELGVSTVIGVSTDKAAPPVRNTYGMTKALMERLFCSLDGKTQTRFACVRFGNIAWSTGSVFPIWRTMLSQDGFIGTTGPEMRRFFFRVEEAVTLVTTALDHIDEVHGQVLSRVMKASLVRDILEVWVAARGGSWKVIEGRPGDRPDEDLIGELELPYTRVARYGDVDHFVIAFNTKSAAPPKTALSSANAERLSKEELLALIRYPEEVVAQ